MAVDFEFAEDPGGPMVEMTADLCLTADRQRLVPEGDPEGRWKYCAPGQMKPRAEAEKYGLLQAEPEPELQAEPEPELQAEPEAEPEPETPEVKAPKPDLKAIRAWAEENELDIPKRGRIPETVVELYNEAQED